MVPSFLVPLLCNLYIFQRADSLLHLTLLPAGTCFYCCPIQLNRDVQFQLYTRRNPTFPSILDPNDVATLWRSNFNVKHPTIVYIHGYSDSSSGKGPVAIRNAYLRRGHYNVILINWAKLAVLPWYITAVRNARIVGRYMAHMMLWLEAQKAVPMSKIHVIGFSLGAEAAGFMGKALKPRKIGRITGLDPAYPLYMNTGEEGHLTWADAAFVDVIHTDGGNLGFPQPLGHVDFYPNGGSRRQPGCDLRSLLRMSFRRIINQYSEFADDVNFLSFIDFFCKTNSPSILLFSACSYLRTQSSLALLRGIGGEPLRVSRESMPKMATGDSGELRVGTRGSHGLCSKSQVSGKILFEHERATTVR
ncbi:hepatic triacylglycerol lipase-like isoform X1 [Anoplolepis gracilipes]|uniref:hepatic triacylglycerol lipase-like isoform X1 n=1 Tax=Anoplolepis gracilipes TaxID=354296 RepID=UPI003BA1CA72